MAIPYKEQESIFIFDVERRQWHVDLSYMPHVRKYAPFMVEIEEQTDERLAGWINAEDFSTSVMVKKKKRLTDDEKITVRKNLTNSNP